jgi:hypothetical protein
MAIFSVAVEDCGLYRMPQRLFDSRLFLLCLIDGAEAAGHGGSLTFTQTRQLVQASDPPCPAV